MHHDRAQRGRLEAAHAECFQDEVVLRRGAQHLVVRRAALRADEPVPLRAKQVSSHDRAQVVFGLQRLPRAKVVVVVVLDVSERRNDGDPMMIGVERRAHECRGDL